MGSVTKEQVIETLKGVFDPEIPVDVYNFGLIYDIAITDDDVVQITMSLTSESCPSAREIPEDIKKKMMRVAGVKSCEVEVVWDPKWTPERISADGRKILHLDDDDE